LDGSATPSVTAAEAAANTSLPAQKQLGASYVKPSSAVQSVSAQSRPGTGQPVGGIGGTGQPIAGIGGTGQPTTGAACPVFVVGPIVIFGSDGGQTGAGTGQPVGGIGGTGRPNS
jgi:hypothetical protein